MGNNKGSGIFLGVIGVATLIVAIIGATFAFFGANISSPEGAVSVTTTQLSLGYSDIITGLKKNLIPAEHWVAEHAGTDETYLSTHNECIDTNGNEVCGTYTFTIGNPSFTTAQDLYGSVKVITNDFTNLWFRIYEVVEGEDEEVTLVQKIGPTKFPTAEGTVDLDGLNQQLLPSSSDTAETSGFDATKPLTYTKVEKECTNSKQETYTCSNVKTYKMLIWLEETGTNQTDAESGKTITASVTFTTASDTSGVTGVIHGMQKPSGYDDDPALPETGE